MTAPPTALLAGLVLPESVLSSTAFITFALFVGFNTVIYLGLTVAKFMPWPPQVPVARVRQILPTSIAKDASMRQLTPAQSALITGPVAANRNAVAQQTIPLALALSGALLLVNSLLSMALNLGAGVEQFIIQMVTAIAFLALAQVGFRRKLTVGVLAWTWVAAMTIAVAELTIEAVVNDSTIGLGYAVLAMTALVPVAMAWRPAIAGGVIALVIVCAGGVVEYQADGLRWGLMAATGLVIGGVLLQLRLTTVDNLTLEQLRANALATTDPLTGLLSRHGLITMADAVAGNAARLDKDVTVIAIKVDGMSSINANYGADYGNTVLMTVGTCLGSITRDGDLIARWGGTRFVVLGIGERPDPHAFARRLEQAVDLSGVALGKSAITVTVGSVAAPPRGHTLLDLVDQAMADMASGSDQSPRP